MRGTWGKVGGKNRGKYIISGSTISEGAGQSKPIGRKDRSVRECGEGYFFCEVRDRNRNSLAIIGRQEGEPEKEAGAGLGPKKATGMEGRRLISV